MIVHLPVWFNLLTYFLGMMFLYLGYKIWSKKEITMLGNMGKLKEEKDLNTVCHLASAYSFVLGAVIISIPLVNVLIDFYAVIALVGIAFIGSMIFWFTLPKVFFIPSAKSVG